MAFASETTGRPTGRPTRGQDPDQGWAEPERPPVDWKKRALVVGLGVLSWVATYVGMLELIEANMGELPIIHKVIIGFSVAMLMTMVVWLLDEMFKPNPFFTKILYALGYLFLTIISVGFGFGFYWKVLESRSEASRSAEGAVTQVQSSLVAASTRLDQLTATLDQLTAVSTQKASTEKAAGASCPNSKPGDGPRRKMREDDAARFSFAAEFVKGRATAVKTEMGALDVDLAKITTDDKSTVDAKSGTRNAFMQSLGRKLDNTVTGFNAFRTDPQLRQIRTDLAERAERVTFPDTQGKTYSCPDPQLQTALRGVVRAIDQLPELEKPKIAAVEGSEATIEAFRRLTASFYGLLSFKLPPSADELRERQKKAIQSVEQPTAAAKAISNEQPGLSKRDYVPLAIAIFVDVCLLLVSMGKSHDRLSGLVPKMRAAERGPVIQILSRFNDIHRDRQIRENFELFRHVVFDFHGDYYVAVPLDAPKKLNPREREELRLETQLLSNLFASFEKEKIFSRVYSPFLTAGAVRRRLARQGSKFDKSDAFRLYRFKDGAWSDIILGAVMGAARRVEAEKRVLSERAAEEVAIRAEATGRLPGLDALASRADGDRAHSYRFDDHLTDQPPARPFVSPAANDEPFTGHRRPVHAAGPATAAPLAPAYDERFGAYAPFVAPGTDRAPQPVANVRPLPDRAPYPEFRDAPAVRADAFTTAANSNTAPHHQTPAQEPWGGAADVLPFPPATAIRAPAAAPPVYIPPTPAAMGASALRTVEPMAFDERDAGGAMPDAQVAGWQREMGIVMTRVTESIRVPVTSQAALPQALVAAGLMRREQPAGPAVPPPLPVAAPVPLIENVVQISGTDSHGWSDDDAAIAKKYAGRPAE